MKDNGTAEPPELRKKVQRLVSRWSELNKEHTSSEVNDAERRQELWLTPPEPYPGLRSFAPNESELFFARKQQVEGLIQRLTNSNIMVVLGGSGCGKSSLVRAGLIPRLSTSGAVPGRTGRWYVVEYRPGRDPNSALLGGFRDSVLAPVSKFMPPDDPELGRRALVQALDLDRELIKQEPQRVLDQAMAKISTKLFVDTKDDTLRSAPLDVDGLFELAHDVLDRIDIELSRGARAGRPNLLILIDQFEEAFRPEVTIEGLRNLCTLIKSTFKRRPPSLFLAITLRSEELHRCAEAGLASIVTETAYLLGPLDDEEARREIIVQPARAVFNDWLGTRRKASDPETAPFDPDVVQILMDESQRILGGAGHKSDYLPLLQHALQQVWNSAMSRWGSALAENGPLDLRICMDDLEGAATSLEPGFLARCLNKFVNEAYDEAVAEVAAKRFENDAKATEKAERTVRTAFSAMARQDDRGNWARRSISAKWVAELLDDIEPDPDANLKAADDVLRIFQRHGYLNRSVGREGEEYDVSHEALIRNWSKYDGWLRELGAIGNSVSEVVNDLESRRQEEASAQARRSPRTVLVKMFHPFWDRILDWILESKEKRATTLITDQHRDNIGKVVGAERTVSIGLAAALLADSERRKSARLTGSSITLDEPTASNSQQRSQLEIGMRERIKEIEPDWSLAEIASKRFMPRLAYTTGLVGLALLGTIILGAMLAFWTRDLNVANDKLTQSQDRLQFGAVAAAANLDASRWLEAVAFELERVYDRINAHLREESLGDNQSATQEMGFSLGNWERAARQLTGAIIVRESAAMPVAPKANCLTSGSELLRKAGAVAYGVAFDPVQKVWLPEIKSGLNTDAAVQDSKTFALAKEGDMVCLSQYAPMLMVWPAGSEDEPLFWMLRPRCREISAGTCTVWLMEPLRLRVLFIRKYLEKLKDRPWRSLWLSKDRDERADLWNNKEIYDFETRVPGAPPRIGFAFKFANGGLLADTVPGMIAPYVLPEAADLGGMSACTESPCVFKTLSSAVRISYKKPPTGQILEDQLRSDEAQAGNGPDSDECKSAMDGGCLIKLSIEAVPSEGNAFVGVWNWMFQSLPIDSVVTNGQIMDYRAADGLWRRGVIGVKALAQHVKFLAGSTSDDASKVKLHFRDLSEACLLLKCREWKPLADSESSSWNW